MKKFALAFLGMVLVLGMAACRCSVERRAVEEVDRSHALIDAQLLKYVEKDATLKQKDRDDWKSLIESNKRNLEKLKKALE